MKLATALHGVAGCRPFAVVLDGEIIKDVELAKSEVDPARDVILLYSQRLLELVATKKLTVPDVMKLSEVTQDVWIKGYPRNAQTAIPKYAAVSDTRKTLENIIEQNGRLNSLRDRKSPSTTDPVVTLTSINPLSPGESGAPILDTSGKVVAIGNGGFEAGDLAWGFPMQNVQPAAFALAESVVNYVAHRPIDGLYSFAQSPVQPIGFLPAVSATASLSTTTPEGQISLQLPFEIGNQRFFVTGSAGRMGRTSEHAVDTLPGLSQIVFSEKRVYNFFEAGASYHPRRLPQGKFDPYVHGGVGLIGNSAVNRMFTTALGLDFFVGGYATVFTELGVRRETIPDATIKFNNFGSPLRVESTATQTRFQANVGVRVRFKTWGDK